MNTITPKRNNMIEAGAALLISLIAMGIGFGMTKQKVDSLQEFHNERYLATLKEIEFLKNNQKIMNDLLVAIAEMKKDIHYIKEAVRKVEQGER